MKYLALEKKCSTDWYTPYNEWALKTYTEEKKPDTKVQVLYDVIYQNVELGKSIEKVN